MPNVPPHPADPLIGLELGEYRITKRLGEGGMGVVYAGLQPVIRKPVAIKILQTDALAKSDEADRLIAEARAANAVHHRGIVDVFAFGKLPDGRPYIVMDLLEGEALDAVIEREAPLSVDRVLAILDDVLDTLSAAHAAGVIHRDLKPANLFLVRQAHGGSYVRILDFGLAKLHDAGSAQQGARASMIAGTPHYIAPEQALGEVVGPRADLYSVGCIAYELLTGRLPFDTEDPIQQITRRLNEKPERAAVVARVPSELDDIVMRLLERDPAARPASAGVVRQQLAKFRRNLQNDATVMGARPEAPARDSNTVVEPEPAESADSKDRLTVCPPRKKPHRLAIALAIGGALLFAAAIAAVLLVPHGRGAGTALEIPDEPKPAPAVEPEDEPLRPPPPRPADPDPEPPAPPPSPAIEPRPTPPVAPPQPRVQPAPEKPAVSAADQLEARRKGLLAKIGKYEKANASNQAALGMATKLRAAARNAKTLQELKDAEQEALDLIP